MFLVPTLLLKAALLYFGIHYALYPDEGYGTGLIITVILSFVNAGIFIWQARNDPED